MRGCNVDPLNPTGAPSPATLKAVGFNAVRLVMRGPGGGPCEQYAKACKDAGLFVLGVLGNESAGFLIANADCYQVGNEPDGAPPSSWVMSPQEYIDLWTLYRDTYPDFKMIAAGLSSGNYHWWADVAPKLEGCSGVAVHPYGKSLVEAKQLLSAYRAVKPDIPVWVTEWNRPAEEIPGYDWWLRQNTAGGFWFCWSDGMVSPFGLVKAEIAQFHPFVETPPAPIPSPVPLSVAQVPSPNFWTGRPSGPPIALVLHTMAGSLASTDGWFSNPASQVSAHYGVGLHGMVHQYVQLGNSAWANGILEAGNQWPGLTSANPNYLTASIETEDLGNNAEPVTDSQYAAVLGVARIALTRYPSIKYLLGHHAISPQTRLHCPGARWVDSGRFARLAADLGLKGIP